MRVGARRSFAVLLAVALAPGAISCRRTLTEIVVVVDSDLCEPGALDRVEVSGTGPTGRAFTNAVGAASFPVSVSLLADGDPAGALRVRASGSLGGATVIAQERAVRFVPGTSRVLRLGLLRACREIACGPTQTCVDGACTDAELSELPTFTGSSDLAPQFCSADAGADASVDASACPGVDLATDPQHCGSCETACTSGFQCQGGVCEDRWVAEVGGGMEHTCARRVGGDVLCWGSNSEGQLGDGSMLGHALPVRVQNLANVRQLVVGAQHACALLTDGRVWCWGRNFEGQLGIGTMGTKSTVPVMVGTLGNVVGLTAGAWHTCAQRGDRTVYCWGRGTYGQLGEGATANRATPVLVDGVNNVRELACGAAHCCALSVDGAVRCWGSNSVGQIGDGTTTNRPTAVVIGTPADVQGLAGGYQHSCLRTASGQVYCWGDGGHGKLGDGVTPMVRTRISTPVSGLTDAQAIWAGAESSCALRRTGEVSCWGTNLYGQLGDGTTIERATPVAVAGATGVGQLRLGYYHACVLLTATHSLACWGQNSSSQLGTGSASDFEPRLQAVRGLR